MSGTEDRIAPPGGGRGGPIATAAVVAAMTGTAAVELAEGRSPLCRCGVVRLWNGRVDGPENSQQVTDWYSLSHLVHGLLFYAATRLLAPRWPVRARVVAAALVECAWEIAENSPVVIDRYRSATASLGYVGDSVLNSMSDVAFMPLGFAFAARARTSVSVAAGIMLEITALIAIRDDLTLNVLMLVHPIAAVRVWQGG